MSATDVIEYIGNSMEHGKRSDDVYRELYEKAFGATITRELAETWVKSMSVTDGSDRSNGQKWTYDTCTEVGSKVGVSWEDVTKCEWYCVMNMMYSDYFDTGRYADRQNDPLFYAHLAKDWVYDNDVTEKKTYLYYFNVVCAD